MLNVFAELSCNSAVSMFAPPPPPHPLLKVHVLDSLFSNAASVSTSGSVGDAAATTAGGAAILIQSSTVVLTRASFSGCYSAGGAGGCVFAVDSALDVYVVVAMFLSLSPPPSPRCGWIAHALLALHPLHLFYLRPPPRLSIGPLGISPPRYASSFASSSVLGTGGSGGAIAVVATAAFDVSSSTLQVFRSAFRGCSASTGGGGVFVAGSIATLTSTTFIACRSSIAGGGVAVTASSTMTLEGCAFERCYALSDDSASGAGGGIHSSMF